MLEICETWRSRVYLTATDVWKVKKPVRLPFLDYTSLPARRVACERELELNEALAPGVYLEVVPVTRGFDGRQRFGAVSDTVSPEDWAVHMLRLPDSERLDVRLREERVAAPDVRVLAGAIAAFHAEAEMSNARAAEASVEALVRLELPSQGGRPLPPEATAAREWQLGFLAARRDRFEARARAGRVRDGHGELAPEHVYIDDRGGVRVIDRIEFDARLRRLDVCADVASLSSELAAAGRVDLAECFLAEYASAANDFDLYPLIDFFASLRASVRARFHWFYADHFREDPLGERVRHERARRLFALALAAPHRPLLPPVVVAMGGMVASGKSTLAQEIGREIGAPVVSTDRTRDFLLGEAREPARHELHWERAYAKGFGERVYAETLRRAGAVLRSGRPVVVDGCFRSAAQRGAARDVAARLERPFLFVETRVPEAVQRARLHERSLRDGDDDAAWLEIADALAKQWEPARELGERDFAAIDTSRPIDENLARLRERLPTWPEGLTG